MQFESYPAERLAIESIVSRLEPRENDFRHQLINYGILHKKPFNINGHERPSALGALSDPDAAKMAQVLLHKKVMAAADNGDVNFIYPLSLVPTAHQVFLKDGRSLFAMCAVDAIGTSFTFNQDVHVTSKCSECGKPVRVEIRDGRVSVFEPEEIRVLHVDLNKFDNWACGA